MWVDNARIVNPHMTWEELKPTFIEFIRGGRASRTVQVERMSKLVYGQGKCKDLLSLEKEFEELRMRLYPSRRPRPLRDDDLHARGHRLAYAEPVEGRSSEGGAGEAGNCCCS